MTSTSTSNVQQRRKGTATICRKVEHKGFVIADVIIDPLNKDIGKETMVFFNKTKQSWMPELLPLGAEIAIELPLKQGRDIDLITFAAPTHLQPVSVQQLEPGKAQKDSQNLFQAVTDIEASKRVTGRLRDPETQKAFEEFMAKRGLTQTEAVDVLIQTGLRKMGYQA
tara:strand:- start:503 stop:1006 length:504 start_codon:yes stop_codon:yes gene_type:complete